MINKTWLPYGTPCVQCNKDNDPYMLTHELWRQITSLEERKKCICLECVEVRLGRQLQREDFLQSNPPINHGIFGFDVDLFLKSRKVS